MPDELTKALLLEELASEGAVAEALFASVTRRVPIVQALVESGAVTAEILGRYLARTEAPYLRQVAPLRELVERLPAGLCERLLALPVRHDAITGTVDVVVADAGDPHPAKEIAFHLGAPVRLVRASASAIDEALRRLKQRSLQPSRPPSNAPPSRGGAREGASERARARPPPLPPEIAAPAAPPPPAAQARPAHPGYAPPPYSIGTPAYGMAAPVSQGIPTSHGVLSHGLPPSVRRPARDAQAPDDDRIYDSRPRAGGEPEVVPRRGTLPPPDPGLRIDPRAYAMRDEAPEPEAPRPSREPGRERQAHVVPARPATPRRMMSETPPWGTPMHNARTSPSDAPRSDLGSEIPIPLTRRTFAAVSGGTQRPPPLRDPTSMLGEGYAVEAGDFREIVELDERGRAAEEPPYQQPPHAAQPQQPYAAQQPPPHAPAAPAAPVHAAPLIAHAPPAAPIQSFIPGPPPLPRGHALPQPEPPQLPFAEIGGILAALRAATSRDEVLELVLTGARLVALKVALFVVKRGGYLGWACTPEFADRGALQSVLIPLESASVFDEAVREGLYLGAMRHDEVHAALLHVMGGASRDVAVVPIRVSGRTAVVVLADELGDTMLATRRLEELAHAGGEAFARIVRQRR